jgi:hypothetical protein
MHSLKGYVPFMFKLHVVFGLGVLAVLAMGPAYWNFESMFQAVSWSV